MTKSISPHESRSVTAALILKRWRPVELRELTRFRWDVSIIGSRCRGPALRKHAGTCRAAENASGGGPPLGRRRTASPQRRTTAALQRQEVTRAAYLQAGNCRGTINSSNRYEACACWDQWSVLLVCCSGLSPSKHLIIVVSILLKRNLSYLIPLPGQV